MTKIRQMMAPMISSFGSICRSLRLHEAIAACIANTTTTTIKMMYGDKTHIIALVTTEEVDCVVSKQAAKAVEADGSLMITDRLKDVIKSGGEWISSLKLESIASAVDGVSEVAAIGVPHPKWGERPRLLLVLVVGADAERVLADITAALEAEIAMGALSKWALPERIDVVAELARTSVGKIDKKRLRAQMKSD